MEKTVYLLLAMMIGLTANAQTIDPHLDVEGNAKIRGNIDIITTDGDSSVFIGANAGINDDGTENLNTFVGPNTGRFNSVGSENAFFGESAGRNNTSGRLNTFIGSSAGRNNTEGVLNIFVGYRAGINSVNGNHNAFIGDQSGFQNTGDNNSYFGSLSGALNTSGEDNAFFGRFSGYNFSNNRSTLLGHGARTTDSLNRAIAIGFNAEVACHNCAAIGGTGADAVKVGIGTSTPSEVLHVIGNALVGGNLDIAGCYTYGGVELGGNCLSDINLKENVQNLDAQLSRMIALRPVEYDWKHSAYHNKQRGSIGLIAQEVEKIIPEMVTTDEQGIKRIKYDLSLQIRMIKAIQEQQAIIDQQALQLEIQTLENKSQGAAISELEKQVSKLSRLVEVMVGESKDLYD